MRTPSYKHMPDDFATVAKDMTIKDICQKWGCGKTVAQRWRNESGVKKGYNWNYLPIPHDFAERAYLMKIVEIAATWGVCNETACRWRKESGIGPRPVPPPKPLKINRSKLQQLSNTKSKSVIAAHLGVSVGRVTPIQKAENIVPAPPREPGFHPSEPAAFAFLQRKEAIWHCSADGSLGGKFIKFRGKIYDQPGIVEKAKSMGWDADEWRRIPAPLAKNSPATAIRA